MGNAAETSGQVVRMLHTSDVHIGYVRGPEGDHHDICQCAIHALVEAVDVHRADVLMIAGDLFDHGRLTDDDVGMTLRLLGKSSAEVVIIPGNHDVHDEASIWDRCADQVADSGVQLLDDHGGSSIELVDGGLTIQNT